jgi:type IV secretory pathway VirB10-like protein
MSQFSYELDERQIRIMLQNAELDYNEAAWQQFETMAVEAVRSKVHVPKFNVGLSRQILVPVFFVVIICGLSALLFSFVDFKKKQPLTSEKSMQAVANEDKRETTPPQKSAAPVGPAEKKDSVNLAAKEIPVPKPETVQAPQIKQAPVEAVKKEVPAFTAVVVKKDEPRVASVKKEAPLKRKKRRRGQETFEDLPAINTSISNLGSDTKEPEPEIRMN